jgi:hypothetical protein
LIDKIDKIGIETALAEVGVADVKEQVALCRRDREYSK